MILHKDPSHPAVFLAGGIGITPFMSIIKQAVHDNATHQLYLFYSNRSQADAAYLDELQQIATQHQNVKIIATMTDDQNWQGEKGYITVDMIQKYVGSLEGPIYYIAGPLAFTDSMIKMLTDKEVDSLFIRSEDFNEYK